MRSILVSDVSELVNIARAIPPASVNKYSTLFSTGDQQLVLLENGEPVSGYKIDCSESSKIPKLGISAMEQYLDTYDDFKHWVMLYDDPILARMLEFRYALRGLEKRQQCMYVIPEDDVETPETIKAQMEVFGINTSHYRKYGCLSFVRIPDPARNPRGFTAGCEKTLNSLLEQALIPVRMILHVRYQLNTRDEIESHADFENVIESTFSEFPGSMLCNHYTGKYSAANHGEWTKKMLQTHDNVFVVSCHGGVPSIHVAN